MTPPSDVFMQGGFGNVEDAAGYLGISVVTVHREVRRGTLSAYRIGGRKLIRMLRADCDAYARAVPAVEKYQPRIVRRSRAAGK
jgi:excisionase family DNA binding protein